MDNKTKKNKRIKELKAITTSTETIMPTSVTATEAKTQVEARKQKTKFLSLKCKVNILSQMKQAAVTTIPRRPNKTDICQEHVKKRVQKVKKILMTTKLMKDLRLKLISTAQTLTDIQMTSRK